MIKVIEEDFSDFEIGELPYDRFHTALGEYHYIKNEGYYGNWYDPIANHQWRSLGGSWLITFEDGKHYIEQNRGDKSFGSFESVYSVLAHKIELFSPFILEYKLKQYYPKNFSGMAFCYQTSRNYYAIGIRNSQLVLLRRQEEDFNILKEIELDYSGDEELNFRILIGEKLVVFVNSIKCFSLDFKFCEGKIALISKSACRFGDIVVSMENENFIKHQAIIENKFQSLQKKKSIYSKLKLFKKIDLKNFGSGRQLRFKYINNKGYFALAQHQKRICRDSYANISCITVFNIDGNVLWQWGEANNSFDTTLISCDLPFQIGDINNDGNYELIFASNFKIYILDFLSGKILKIVPTPLVLEDKLVKDYDFSRLNVDAIEMADFSGKGYKSDLIIKDRYHNVWALDSNFNVIFRYHHKNTGHFPYIYDFNKDGKDEMLVGYDLVSSDGKIIWSIPFDHDHTDEIIFCKTRFDSEERFYLASGNEGFNTINKDGSIYKHNEIGHAQRISIADYDKSIEGNEILVSAFWGSIGIVKLYDCYSNFLREKEFKCNGVLVSPVNFDGAHCLALVNSSKEGGLIDGDLDVVVDFPDDGHPTLCCEALDIDNDGIDELLCFDQSSMWIYKAEKIFYSNSFERNINECFSNYKGEFLLSKLK